MPMLSIKKEVQVEAKMLKLHLKVSDQFYAALVDQSGAEIFSSDDDGSYVPEFMPGEHYGDYVILDIELDTGKILNWTPPTAEQIQAWMEGDKT